MEGNVDNRRSCCVSSYGSGHDASCPTIRVAILQAELADVLSSESDLRAENDRLREALQAIKGRLKEAEEAPHLVLPVLFAAIEMDVQEALSAQPAD